MAERLSPGLHRRVRDRAVHLGSEGGCSAWSGPRAAGPTGGCCGWISANPLLSVELRKPTFGGPEAEALPSVRVRSAAHAHDPVTAHEPSVACCAGRTGRFARIRTYVPMTNPADPSTPYALVVGDDGLICMDAMDILGDARFRTVEASHGDKAIALLAREQALIVRFSPTSRCPAPATASPCPARLRDDGPTSLSWSPRGRRIRGPATCRAARVSSASPSPP